LGGCGKVALGGLFLGNQYHHEPIDYYQLGAYFQLGTLNGRASAADATAFGVENEVRSRFLCDWTNSNK